jgi:hypothetical protein
MLWTRGLVPSLSLLLLLLYCACAHTPRALNDDASVVQMRADYVREHPGGPFNRYIEVGKVVRGMDFTQVSASWGLPEARWLSRNKKLEFWTYFGKDDVSGDWTRYTFEFEGEVLTGWELDRHFIKNGALTRWQIPDDGSSALTAPRAPADLSSK